VAGSDHLTAYNLYAEAVNQCGRVGEVYGLPRHVFGDGLEDLAERRGVLIKALEDAALGMASVYRSLELPLPGHLRLADERMLRRFQDLLARVMPLDLVIDEDAADGTPVRVSRGSVCGSWGGVAGTIRYFADRNGIPRAAVEGTQLPLDLIRQYARAEPAEIVYDARNKYSPLVAVRRLTYFGFELDRERSPLETIPPELADAARGAIVEALVTGSARHRDAAAIRLVLEQLGELYRRSGGTLAGADGAAVRTALGTRLGQVRSLEDFQHARLSLTLDDFVPAERRRELEALPAWVDVTGERCALDYEVDEGRAIVRIRMREQLAHNLTDADIPTLDRPVAFTIMRRKQSALRADSLAALRQMLKGERRSVRPRRGSAKGRRRRP